jgi:MYXO-CTERM domain-containing protein
VRSVLAFCIGLAACEPAPDPSSRSFAIIGGTYDPGDPAVAAVLEESGNLICTATLVAPRVLVTAAHCVVLGTPRYVFFGPDPGGDGLFVDVLLTRANPTFDLETLDNDIGVIVLDQAAPSFAGAPLTLAAVAPTVGLSTRMIGYGYTEVGPAGDYATKHALTVAIDEVDALSFRYGIATCNGDSGGPALADEAGREVVAGITSWGDATCGEYGVDTRVDVYREWVETAISEVAGPSCDAADGCLESCVPRDADCPVTPVGDGCARDFDCGELAVCYDDTCRARCDPTAATPMCGADEHCVDVESLVVANLGACVPEDGCACRVGGRPGGPSWLALTGLLLLLLRNRRTRYDRRRCASRSPR